MLSINKFQIADNADGTEKIFPLAGSKTTGEASPRVNQQLTAAYLLWHPTFSRTVDMVNNIR
jgi:hypothetical protein